MKRVLLLCLIAIASLKTHAAASGQPQPVQAYTAVVWTTRTLHSPAAKATTFMQRTVFTRDASGNTRRETYEPTKGLQHDVTAPLEGVLTGSTSAQALPLVQSSKETMAVADLGTLQFFGLPAAGRRQTFHDANGQPTHTLEIWFNATLGLTVHMEGSNARGDSLVSDLSELHLGDPGPPSAETATVAKPAIPLLMLYRGLFTHIAHMERDRLANDPNFHVNMNDIENHLRDKLGLSAAQWQALVDKSVKVESYTREMSKQAHVFPDQDLAARRENPLSASTLTAGRATLHKMQQDLNTHVQGEIDQLKASIGPDATNHMETYLQGPMAASMSVTPVNAAQVQAQRAQKEQAR